MINQTAIDNLAKHPGVIKEIEDQAKNVVEKAKVHVEAIMDRSGFATSVSSNVGFTMIGNQAVIGIKDGTSRKGKTREQYLADKQADPAEAAQPHGHWLTKGLENAGFRPA